MNEVTAAEPDPEPRRVRRKRVMEGGYCPICGVWVDGQHALVAGLKSHQCDPKKLAARDAALNKGGDARLQGHSLQERLKDGFEMLGDEQ